MAHGWSSSGDGAAVTAEPRPAPLADLSACPKLRIAIVNQITSHYEVLLGLLHLFEPHAQQTDVFISELTTAARGVGAWELLRPHHSNFYFLNASTHALLNSSALTYDLVVLVSPEYHRVEIGEMVRLMRPHATVLYVHNIPSREFVEELFGAVAPGAGEVKLVTLSPHTSDLLSSMTGQPVEWVLAAYPFASNHSCEGVPDAELLGGCLRGFAVQGTLEGSRRGYGQLWSELQSRRAALSSGAAARLFHVTVMGKGSARACGLPDDLAPLVTVSANVPFPAFYEAQAHSLAILPALNNATYLRSKFTSSILSSLIAGTPLVANRTFLAAYRMLTEEAVHLQGDGESEVEAMLRLVNSDAGQIREVRRGVAEARRRVNEHAAEFFGGLLTRLCGGG